MPVLPVVIVESNIKYKFGAVVALEGVNVKPCAAEVVTVQMLLENDADETVMALAKPGIVISGA